MSGIRKKFPALCASGKIEFVYCEPEKYPLVYLRTYGEEKILAALNPSEREVSIQCPYELQEKIYTLGSEVTLQNGMLIMPGESAGFGKVV